MKVGWEKREAEGVGGQQKERKRRKEIERERRDKNTKERREGEPWSDKTVNPIT